MAHFFRIPIISLLVSMISVPALSKEYRITQKAGSFEDQLSSIIYEINSTPGHNNVIVRIDKGYYPLSHTINIECTSHRIELCGSRNKQTIILGSYELTEWEEMPEGLWRCKLPYEVRMGSVPGQLFVNGERAVRTKTPKHGYYILKDGLTTEANYYAVLDLDECESLPSLSSNEIPLLTIYRKWTASKRYITDINKSAKSILFSGIEFPSHNKFGGGNRVVIENTKIGMDTPGSWYVDKESYIYYKPKAGESIENTEFRIPTIEKLFTIKGKANSSAGLVFRNIVFEHTSYVVPEEGSEYGQAASEMSAAIEVDNIKDFSFEDCEMRNIANYGIWLRKHCSYSNISTSYFHDLGAGAIKIGTVEKSYEDDLTNHITVDNNIISHYGMLMENAVGVILFRAADCRIKHNDIHYGYYTGISLGWVWGFANSPSKRNEVSYNWMSYIGDGRLNDVGGIYTLGKSEGTHIHHNVITDVYSWDFRGWGIYADEGTSGVLVEKNVVSRCTSGGYHLHYGANNVVRNNIFAWGEKSQFTLTAVNVENPLILSNNIFIMESGALLSGAAVDKKEFIINNNCYWSISDKLPQVQNIDVLTWIQRKDSSSVFQDPFFKDPQNGDFRLKKKNICKMIGFVEFDYQKAGVCGKRKWRHLAASVRSSILNER